MLFEGEAWKTSMQFEWNRDKENGARRLDREYCSLPWSEREST